MKQIRDIIKAIRPAGISNFDVEVKNSASWVGSGTAWSKKNRVVVRVATARTFRARMLQLGGAYLPHAWGTRTEVLLCLLAHELRHLWQAKHRRRRVWGARGQFSERDADAYALRMLRKYRRGELLERL